MPLATSLTHVVNGDFQRQQLQSRRSHIQWKACWFVKISTFTPSGWRQGPRGALLFDTGLREIEHDGYTACSRRIESIVLPDSDW